MWGGLVLLFLAMFGLAWFSLGLVVGLDCEPGQSHVLVVASMVVMEAALGHFDIRDCASCGHGCHPATTKTNKHTHTHTHTLVPFFAWFARHTLRSSCASWRTPTSNTTHAYLAVASDTSLLKVCA